MNESFTFTDCRVWGTWGTLEWKLGVTSIDDTLFFRLVGPELKMFPEQQKEVRHYLFVCGSLG